MCVFVQCMCVQCMCVRVCVCVHTCMYDEQVCCVCVYMMYVTACTSMYMQLQEPSGLQVNDTIFKS